MKGIELKPCPFCGGEAEVRFVSEKLPHVLKKYHNRYVFAGCRKCGIVTALYNAFNKTGSPLKNEANTIRAKQKAINDWNRRADNEQREAD
jgi:predicted nucleic-acid-binding Zn-ribbon protein